MPTLPANISMGRGSGKDGRPTAYDLIQAREAKEASRDAEKAYRKELVEGGIMPNITHHSGKSARTPTTSTTIKRTI